MINVIDLGPFEVQYPLLNRISFGQNKSDNNNRMIQLPAVFYALLKYSWANNIWLQEGVKSIIRYPIKQGRCNEKKQDYSPNPESGKFWGCDLVEGENVRFDE
jgi:hypothetical protein